MDRRLPCGACATWTCARCGWQRHRAALAWPDMQDCARCGSTEGSMVPTRHGSVRGIYEDHNPRIGPRCQAWAVLTAQPECECRHESCWGINHH
jgi:hypothetical protein